jgi:hypothetical protein
VTVNFLRLVSVVALFGILELRTVGKRQGNESRLTSRLPENLQQVLRVPGGALSPSFDGSLGAPD